MFNRGLTVPILDRWTRNTAPRQLRFNQETMVEEESRSSDDWQWTKLRC